MIIVGTNSYGDEAGLVSYAGDRGVIIALEDAPRWLLLAMDWLERQSWIGQKYDYTQPLSFPRSYAYYDDIYGEVPASIIAAQYHLAMLMANTGDDPNVGRGQAIKRERVEGVVDVEYQDYTSTGITYPQISQMVSRYLLSSGTSFTVSRA